MPLLFLPAPPSLLPIKPPHQQSCTPPTRIYASASPLQLGPFSNVTPLCLGTWSWGNRVLYDYTPEKDKTLEQTLETALTLGVNLIDTADSYGTFRYNARAEVLLGDFLRSPPADLIVATKFAAYPWRLTARSIVNAAEASANRLNRVVDLGQLHWSTANYNWFQERALWKGIADAKQEGYIREIGVSNFGPRQLKRFASYLERRGMRLATAQTQFSLIRRQAIEGELKEVAKELNVGLLGYSPLCLGLLSGKYRNSSAAGLRGVLFAQLQSVDQLITEMEAMGPQYGCTTAQIGLAWALGHGMGIISGARTPTQVREAMYAQNVALSAEDVERLTRVAGKTRQMIGNAFETS